MRTGGRSCLGAAALCLWGALLPLEAGGGPPGEEPRSWPDQLQAGSMAYENLEFAEASRILKEIISGLEDGREGRDTIKILARADLYLGMVYLAEGLESLSEKQFDLACLLDPDLELDPQLFSPGIVAGFEKARRRVESRGRIILKVETRPPGAEVFLDGRPAGRSPLSVPVIPGTHYLAAEGPGGPLPSRKLEIRPGEAARVLLEPGMDSGESLALETGGAEEPGQSPGGRKKALIIGGAALAAMGTAAVIILLCADGGESGPGGTGEVFVRW